MILSRFTISAIIKLVDETWSKARGYRHNYSPGFGVYEFGGVEWNGGMECWTRLVEGCGHACVQGLWVLMSGRVEVPVAVAINPSR
jgi:hypothetical protein